MACAVAFLLAGVSLTAHAALVRVDFSGVVDEIRGPESALGGSIHVGTPFSGYLTYDDSTLPNDAQLETEFAPAWAIYYFPGVVDGVHGEIGDFVRTTSFVTLMEISDRELFPSADPSHLYLAGGFATSTPPS